MEFLHIQKPKYIMYLAAVHQDPLFPPKIVIELQLGHDCPAMDCFFQPHSANCVQVVKFYQ